MSTDRIQRLLPLSGALFAVVMAAGFTLTSGEPDNGASAATIYHYWHTHQGVQLISDLLLIPFAVLFLIVFAAELRRALRSGEAAEATYSPIALGGGLLAAAGLAVTGSLGAAVTSAAHHGSSDATYSLAQLQAYDWLPWMVGFAVMLLACGVGGLRTNAFPKSVSISAIVIGLVCLTPVGAFALFLLPMWILVTSVVLYRRGRTVRRPLQTTAPSTA
jgi:hypothetical protein